MLREDERRKLVAIQAQLSMRVNSPTRHGVDLRDEALLIMIDETLRRNVEVTDMRVERVASSSVLEDMLRNPAMSLDTALRRDAIETRLAAKAAEVPDPVMLLRTDESTVHRTVDHLGPLFAHGPIPEGWRRTGEDCKRCSGSGFTCHVPRTICTSCFGSGQQHVRIVKEEP